MKKQTYFGLTALVVVAIAIGSGILYHNHQIEQARLAAAAKAERDFQLQLERNWELIIHFTSLLPVRLDSPRNLRNFANFEYKRFVAAKFRVDETYQKDANAFMSNVHSKISRLLAELTTEMKPNRVDIINMMARDADTAIQLYQQEHPELVRPTPIAVLLESRLKHLTKKDEPPPKIIVVTTPTGYPEWVATSEQRVAWDTARDIVRDYFQERTRLSRAVNWSYARTYPGYLLRSDVNPVIVDAITRRENMLSRLGDVERVQGMSDLSGRLRAMLNNSICGLFWAQKGDYAKFKSFNSANDQIQQEIRRTFGIR